MNNQNMLQVLSQVLTAATSNRLDVPSLVGLVALINLFGIINYMNSDKMASASTGAGAGGPDLLSSLLSLLGGGGAGNTGANLPNMDMLMSLLSMLGGSQNNAGNSSPPNMDLLASLMSMLGGGGGPATGARGRTADAGTSETGAMNPQLMYLLLNLLQTLNQNRDTRESSMNDN